MKQTPRPTVLTAPGKDDPSWQEKAQKALQARELTKSMRQGKPKSFRHTVGKAK